MIGNELTQPDDGLRAASQRGSVSFGPAMASRANEETVEVW